MGVLAEAKMRVQMTGLNEPRMPIQAECSVSVNARLASRNHLGARRCCRSCSPMDPMDVLKYHQHRPAPRRSFAREFGSSRLSTRLEELLAFALRAEVERAAGSDVDRVRRLPVLLVITFRRPKQALVNDHGSEALPDHCFGTAYHLIDNAGGAHQSLGLTDRFTGQQAHLFEVTCELWSWWKSAKSLHGKLLSIKMGLTNQRSLRIRNDLVWRWIVMPFPFTHDAVAQPASRSIREFRTEDQMASSILNAGSHDPVLVMRMGIGLKARE